MLTKLRNSKRGFTAVELVLVIVVLAIIVSVTMVMVDRQRQARLREESAANLRVLQNCVRGLITEGGGIKAAGNFQPLPLSTVPGQLTPEWTPSQIQKLLKSEDRFAFISPAHPDAERMRKDALDNPESAITDASYWYLGYTLFNEEAGLAFVRAYKNAVSETGKPPTANELKVSLRSGDNGVETVQLHRLDLTLGNYSDLQSFAPFIPTFIERPGLQRGGSNVLFLDGKVEFIPYPGKWPMTEKFIKALESLDELKESHADEPEK